VYVQDRVDEQESRSGALRNACFIGRPLWRGRLLVRGWRHRPPLLLENSPCTPDLGTTRDGPASPGARAALGAGILTPMGATGEARPDRGDQPPWTWSFNKRLRFTEVIQDLLNPNGAGPGARPTPSPVPRSASLKRVSTITSGERGSTAESCPARKPARSTGRKRDQGNDTGLAEKNSASIPIRFHVAPVRANSQGHPFRFPLLPVTIEMIPHWGGTCTRWRRRHRRCRP